jgi:hypothetical protein
MSRQLELEHLPISDQHEFEFLVRCDRGDRRRHDH